MTSAKASEAKKHIAGFLLSVTAAAGAAVLCAAPVIDQQTVRLTQDESTGLVTVQYVLTGDPAVVTVDFRTNDVATGTWASIGDGKFAHVKGDVNKLVTAVDTTCSIFWQPGGPDAWPGHRVPGAGFKAVVSAWSTNAPPPYMIVDLKNGSGRTWYYNSAEAIPFGITNDLYKTDRLAFRLVPGRDVQWLMGSPEGEIGVSKAGNEARHLVKFTKDWYMGVYPVTQAQNVFLADGIAQGNRSNRLLRPRPSAVTNDLPDTATFPVDSVGWTSLRGYYPNNAGSAGWWPTNSHAVGGGAGLDRARYRTKIPTLDLPTEAMWEYACRAGTATATYAGDLTVSDGSDPVLGKIAWYAANSGGVTHPVGLKDPNAWGFYDMLGNVNEWCLDLYDANTPPGDGGGVAVDPPGVDDPTKNNIWYRVARGGCFLSEAGYCRSACRGNNYAGHVVDGSPHEDNVKRIGYRLCCDAMALR